MVLIRQCPGLYLADFHHAVISAKCLVDLPDLFEFLLRKDVGAAHGRKSRSGYCISSGVARQRPLLSGFLRLPDSGASPGSGWRIAYLRKELLAYSNVLSEKTGLKAS